MKVGIEKKKLESWSLKLKRESWNRKEETEKKDKDEEQDNASWINWIKEKTQQASIKFQNITIIKYVSK